MRRAGAESSQIPGGHPSRRCVPCRSGLTLAISTPAPAIATKKPEPPAGPRREAEASEHSHQADVARLQLAGDGLSLEHGHEAGLLNRLALPPEIEAVAGDRGGLAGAGGHQDHDAADGAAEGSGGHGRKGEEHRLQRPHRSGRARAP